MAAEHRSGPASWPLDGSGSSEDRFIDRAAVDRTPYATLVHDGTLCLYASAAAARLFGRGSVEDLVGTKVAELISAQDRTELQPHIEAAGSAAVTDPPLGLLVARTTQLLAAQGEIVEALTTALPVRFEGEPAIQVFFMDHGGQARAERELRQSENRFKTLFERMGQGAVYQNREGMIIAANPSAERILGLSLDQLMGRTSMDPRWRSVRQDGSPFPGEEHPAMRALATGQVISGELMGMFNPVDDSMHWISVTAIPEFRNGDADPYRVFTTFEDVTRLKSAEDRLHEANLGLEQSIRERTTEIEYQRSRFRTTLDGIPEMLILIDTAGKILVANETAASFLGRPQEELAGGNIFDLSSQENTVSSRAMIEEARRNRRVVSGTYDSPDGRHTSHYISPVADANGEVIAYAVLVVDMTDLRRAEESAQTNERRFRRVFENNMIPMALWSRSGGLLEANARFADMLGFTLEEVNSGRISWTDITPPHHAERDRQAVSEVDQRGFCDPYEKEFIHRDGHPIPVLIGGGDIGNNTDIGVLYAVDLTEQKRLSERLLQAQKMEAIGQLAGGIAHEFNNMLTVIIGNSELALDGLPAGGDAHELIQEVREVGERTAALTSQILAFSRRQMLKPQAVDLNESVLRIQTMLRRTLGENITVETRLAEDLELAEVDPRQFEQVLINLAVNARDAMRERGRLTIASLNVDLAGEELADFPELGPGRYVMLTVTDTGEGMDEATRARVFEPFFTTKGLGLGSGLGLATVYGIVQQSGGDIAVESELGKGSTFKVCLPALGKAPIVQQVSEGPRTLPFATRTILLAEDEEPVRKLAERVLSSHGYKVLSAADGREALVAAIQTSSPIDLLLTDVRMPKMNGPELAEQLLRVRPGMKVVYMSGYTDVPPTRLGIPDDVGFIMKPFGIETLLREVRRVLG